MLAVTNLDQSVETLNTSTRKNSHLIVNRSVFMVHVHSASTYVNDIPYSRKYWQELNLAVEPKIAIIRILADLNLAVWYGIAIRIYVSRKFWRIIIWRL